MIYKFEAFKPLDNVRQLIDKKYPYLALIQYEDIIDFYILPDILPDTLNQLAYYLLIAYDIRSFNIDNIKIIPLSNDIKSINQSFIHDTMNSYNIHLLNDSSCVY